VVSEPFKNVLASKVRLTVNDRSCLQDAVTFKVAEVSYGVEKNFSELCPLCVVMIIYACVSLTRHTIRPSSRHSVSGSIFTMAAHYLVEIAANSTQTYLEVLTSVKDILRRTQRQTPQLSSSYPIVCQLHIA